MLEIAEHLVKLSQHPRLTTEQILKNLFPLDEATNRQNPFPHVDTGDDDDNTLPDYEDIRSQEEDNPDTETDTQPQHAQLHQQPTHQQQHQQTPDSDPLHTRTCVATTKRHHETETPPTPTTPPSHKHPRLGETYTQCNPNPTPKRYREPQSATSMPNKLPRVCDGTQTNTLAHIPRSEVTTTAKRPAIEPTAQPEKRQHTEPSHKPSHTSQEYKHEDKPKEKDTKNNPERRSKRLTENAGRATKRSKADPFDTPVPKSEQSARVTAMLMGIFTISTLAFIHKLIPDNSKAKKFIHATRAALAQCTHSMWKSYRHFIVTANVESARHHVRKTRRNYYWNRTPNESPPPHGSNMPKTRSSNTRKQRRTPTETPETPTVNKRHDPGLSPEYVARMTLLNQQLGEGGASSDASPPPAVGV
jgi:hypothetical protein